MTKQRDENLLLKLKHLLWDPLDPWLFYSMLAVYLMSMFLLYSADGQDTPCSLSACCWWWHGCGRRL